MLRQKHDKKFNTQSIGVLNVKTIVCCFVPLRLISGHYWNTIPPSIWSLRYTFEIILNWFCEKITKTLRGFGLDRLKAETLELRHLKCDLTVMFSIIRGFLDIDCNSLFHVIDREPVRTHGHNLRLY